MRFSSTVVSALLISFTGGALASNMGISARDAARRAVLEQRESGCKCKCVDECESGCTAFGGTAGSQVAQGMCVLSCADKCGCDIDQSDCAD